MRTYRLTMALAALVGLAGAPAAARAQGVTTGAITGTVSDSAGNPIVDAQIQIVNRATGFSTGTLTRAGGRYLVQGLEVGGPYTVTARRIGFQPRTENNLTVQLSQQTKVDFKLVSQVAQIGAVTVTVSNADFSPANTGTKAVVSDTSLRRLPTLSRNLTDFIKLTPQVSQSGPGYSGGGMSNRMNNVQIDGASERDVFGLGSTGQPGAEVNAKSVSIDAVKEFQVLLAPFDVRQGNFGGLLLNAITKSGTNRTEGSAYVFYRNASFGADTSVLRSTPFNRTQYGFSLGGPIIKDKLHYFIAPEWQRENSPVTGPYAGQDAAATPAYGLLETDRQRFEQIISAAPYNISPGSSGYVNIPNPLANVFARADYAISDVHRLVARFNYSDASRLRQQNSRSATQVVYESNMHNFVNKKYAPVVQLFSNFKNGNSNEAFFSYNYWYNRRTPLSDGPQIQVNNVAGGPNGNTRIFAGADQFSQGNELDTKTIEFTNNFTMPRGQHTITVGTRNEYVWLRNQFNQSSYGVWQFNGLTALQNLQPTSFRKAILKKDNGNVYFSAFQNALYAQDQWAPSPNFTLTAGMRFDFSNFLKDVDYNAAIDSAYGRRTSDVPKHALQYSPRIGFNWNVTGDEVNQVRGGFGLFVGTPPYVWLENAYVNSGNIITFLNCNQNGSTAPAPAFSRDPNAITACGNGQGSNPIGDVNFLAKDLKFPQPMRTTLAYDRRLPMDLVFTLEGLYSKTLNQLFFVSKNVVAPVGTSAKGRVLYMNAVNGANGAAVLIAPPGVIANGGTARFSTAIDLQNQNKDYAYNLTAQLRKRFSNNWEGMAAYTYGHARDVQSFTSSTAISNWQFGRTLSGRQEDAFTTTSLFDQPHKIMASGSYTLRWLTKYTTDFSFFYQGVSGPPHDYIYGGSGGAGDLNGDGVQGNDLFYVPTDANNASEIQFRNVTVNGRVVPPAEQAAGLNAFIDQSPCLSKNRGKILERNSCRQPFSGQVDVALRQNIPFISGQRASFQFDIFNFSNLLNKNWGKVQSTTITSNSNVPLVTHVGYNTPAGVATTDPVNGVPVVQFTYPTNGEYAPFLGASNFWRSQVSFRYSF